MGSHADIDKTVRIYVLVFVALMVLTLVTVGVSYLSLSVPMAIALALVVASIKGSLVACYFMHLIDEKKLIYVVMGFSVFFFFAVLLLPVLTESNSIAENVGSVDVAAQHAQHEGGDHGAEHGGAAADSEEHGTEEATDHAMEGDEEEAMDGTDDSMEEADSGEGATTPEEEAVEAAGEGQ